MLYAFEVLEVRPFPVGQQQQLPSLGGIMPREQLLHALVDFKGILLMHPQAIKEFWDFHQESAEG
jgi:hypothetical protein